MDEDVRNRLIDAYFAALDAEDVEPVRPVLADDFRYESLAGVYRGPAGLRRYIDDRGFADTTHETTLRVHGESASFVEGTVTGTRHGEPATVAFSDVFAFDDAEEQLTRIAVYVNDS